MEYLQNQLSLFLDDPQLARWLLLAAVMLAVVFLVLSLSSLLLNLRDPVRRRLQHIKYASSGDGNPLLSLQAHDLEHVNAHNWDANHLVTRLIHAGFQSSNAKAVFIACRVLLLLLLPAATLAVALLSDAIKTQWLSFLLPGSACLAWLLPSLYLDQRIAKRQRLLRQGFPDALDLLVVAVESGLGLNQALERVAVEMEVSHPELATELAMINAEVRVGIPSINALHNLAQRTGLEDIRGLVSLLAQSLRFGSSIANTLRVYADEFRDKRLQLAEEQAAKIGTKLIFPLIFCLWPAFFLVAIGPAIIRVLHSMRGF